MTAVQKGDGYYEDVYYTNGRTLSSGVVYLNNKGDFTNAAIQKLGELEDIEEELGIDLVTFHKALKNGVYYKVTDKSSTDFGKIFFDRYVLWGWNQNPDGSYFAVMQSQLQLFNLKDYGKTWALTREELK